MKNSDPHLKRVLSRADLVLYGLVILTPTAPYPVYGTVQQISGGHAALCYLVAAVAMLFTAASYGRMSLAFPVAGSTYTYVQRGLSEHIGFLAGWAMMLDYFLIPLLSVVYAALTAARLLPRVPYLAWAAIFTLAITLINLRGIKMTARANVVLIVILSTSSVLFGGLAIYWVVTQHGASGLLSVGGLWRPETFSVQSLMLGAGISALSYIGFDAVTTLAEDARSPERDLAFATVGVCVLQSVICVLTVYLAALAWPDYRSFPEAETAILDVGTRIGGPWMFRWITFVLLVAGLASAMTGQAGASRLLLGMGRDGAISRTVFGHIDAASSTPTRSVWLMGAVSLAGALLTGFQLIVELLNFGAFVGFILVNVSVISHYWVRKRERRIWLNLVFPAAGALVSTYLWLSLTTKAKLVGFGWLGLGILYLAVMTRGFRLAPRKLEV